MTLNLHPRPDWKFRRTFSTHATILGVTAANFWPPPQTIPTGILTFDAKVELTI
jgi:hypothetical protein